MKLLFKQRMFSWFDSYDIYNEAGDAVYEVKGVLSWGHCLKIFGPDGAELGTVKEEVFSFLPRFALYVGGECVGQIKKEFTFFKPVFTLDCSGWSIEGDMWEWNYLVSDADGRLQFQHRIGVILIIILKDRADRRVPHSTATILF